MARIPELEAVRTIARTQKTDDLEGLCAELQVVAAKATASERAAIYLMSGDESELIMAATPYGYGGDLAVRYRRRPMDLSMLGEVVRTLKPLVFSVDSLPEAHRRPSIEAGFAEYAIVPLHSQGVLTGTLNLARTRKEPYAESDVRLALALGDQISVQIERVRLYLAAQERARSLASLNDELRRSHEELTRAQSELIQKERLASLGELAVVVAHEVRNPLGVIFNVATQLRRNVLDQSPQASELVTILEEEASRLDRIVRAFLEFGRPSLPRMREVRVAALVESAIELTTRAIPCGAITWQVDFDPDATDLVCDEHLLREALVSVFMNAVEAQSHRGRVAVRSSVRNVDGKDDLVITVANDGDAPDAATLERAFEPFFTTKASGTGLGLAIVARTLQAHGGEASIAAKEGGGAVVTLRLPKTPPEEPA